jgi:GT2 family glycosyltransferase
MPLNIDVVILNFNTRNLLEQLLPDVIANSTLPGVKIVVADNASTDGSAEFVRNHYPDLELAVLPKNLGYAGGYNEVLKGRTADYFVLLNSDAEPAPGWLEPLVNLISEKPDLGAAQPKLLDFYQRNKFEYAGASGGFMDRYGYPFCRGRIFGNVEEDKGQYDDTREIFWATGACFLVKREAWERASGLDERFFAHMEEIDLCWRLQLLGYKNYCCPQSVVYHMGGGTLSNLSPRKTFLNFRNNLLMLHKNMHPSERDPVIFRRKLLDGLAACFFILQGKLSHVPQVWKAHKEFAKMRVNVAPTAGTRPLREFGTIMFSGLVWNYFARGKKIFRNIKF